MIGLGSDKIELDLRKFSNGPFSHESDLAPLFRPLLALSLKETTLSESIFTLSG